MTVPKNKINKYLKNVFFITFFFFFSLILLKYYILGDQQHYISLYETFNVTSLDRLMIVFYENVRGTEPISGILLWIGSNLGIDKNIYISFWNAILIFIFYLILKKYNAPWYIIFLLSFNFYLIVLFTGAERLKFCYILIMLGLFSGGKTGIFLILLSPLAHLQGLLFLPSLFLIKYHNNIRNFIHNLKIKKKDIKFIFLLIFIFYIFFYFFYESSIYDKLMFYIKYTEGLWLRDSLKILVFFILSLLVTKKYFLMTSVTLPLFIAALFIGGFRINMILFSVYIYIFLTEEKIKHPISLIIIFYFYIKSIFFIKNIFYYNDGFLGFLI